MKGLGKYVCGGRWGSLEGMEVEKEALQGIYKGIHESSRLRGPRAIDDIYQGT